MWEGCLSDPDTWQINYVNYLLDFHPDLVYDDWYNSPNYSGCFRCHAAVANGQTTLTDEELAAVDYSMRQAAFQGTVAAGTGAVIGFGLGTYFCANDGDCTNEIQSVWRQRPFDRGVAIENALGRSPQLAQNFPVIDRFEDGLATSIKSLDLGAVSYQNISTVTRTVQGYVNRLANWQGARWAGQTIRSTDITARQVILAIPPGATPGQQVALQQLQQWATTQGVTLTFVTVP